MQQILDLIKQDPIRLSVLEQVRRLDLPQCYVAAGFLRNLVWDHLHNKPVATLLNDIDVIYFDERESNPNAYLDYQHQLSTAMPQLEWQVRNQALMHQRNGDGPYTSTLHAMSFWPEKETAVGIRKLAENEFECIAAFGFETLLFGQITHNPKRDRSIFLQRVEEKQWLTKWSQLKVITGNMNEN
ncbi:nucleotidyltransferase family protein [Vibrio chaetopteri]|uniref:nucleotidyltransferase family protein n=1 Tax=Vibrio chaetopteri TaxID=3016528 RepID=UPI003AB4A581